MGKPKERSSLKARAKDRFDEYFYPLMDKLEYAFGIPVLIFKDVAKNGDWRKADDLTRKGLLDPNKDRIPGGYTVLNAALTLCPQDKMMKMLDALFKNGADVNLPDYDGTRPLTIAACRHKKEVIDLLLARGADVNAKSDTGHTALMAAAREGRIDIAETFLARGADINARSNTNDTALTEAIRLKRTEMVKFLLVRGADPSIRMLEYGTRKPGWDAYRLAKAVGEAEIIAALEQVIAAKSCASYVRTEKAGEKTASSNRRANRSF